MTNFTSRLNRSGIALLGVALMAGLASPALAQSTGPVHSGYDANAPSGGHFHVGEVGEKLLYLEGRLRCNCSCGLDVHTCQFQMQCGVSPGWTERIRLSLEAGDSEETIEAGFVSDFGLTVLMAPPVEGFNMLGYFLPGVAILSIGALLGLLIRGGPGRQVVAGAGEIDDVDAARLRDALRQLDESEGPDW